MGILMTKKILDEILKARDEFWDNHGIGCYYDARLDGAIFSGEYPNCNFSKLNLRNAQFVNCYLVNARFEYCNLENVNFTGAQLRFANFNGATLTNANFADAKIARANFSGNDISTCIFDNVRFIENIALSGRKANIVYTKVTNVVYSKKQQISQEFLQFIKKENPHMKNNKVFIVHGHDGLMKEEVATLVENLGLIPIILNEQVNRGKTIIQKLEHYSDVKFAIILLSPCDEGRKKNNSGELKARARQNVILELGFFIGKIGRENICILSKDSVEIPSDVTGTGYISFNNRGWKRQLANELDDAEFDVNMNNL